MDIYYPGSFDFSRPLPAVVMIPGYSDNELRRGLGVSWREVQRSGDWASLLAASGVAAIVWESGTPYFSARDALTFISANAQELRIDVQNLGVLAILIQAQPAMQLLSHGEIPGVRGVDAVALLYPNGQGGYLPASSPSVYIVRAGKDIRENLDQLDRYIPRLEGRGLNVVVVDYKEGVQNFDVGMDTPETREVIQGVLDYFVSEFLER